MTQATPPMCSEDVRGAFKLSEGIIFLNHGSFGAVPEAVRVAAEGWRSKLELRPIEMVGRRMTDLLGALKADVGTYLGADPSRIGFVTNATSGIGAVLRSFAWKAGDRIVLSNHGYNAVRQAVHFCCERYGCEAVIVDLPIPLENDTDISDRFLRAVDDRTRLVIVDHITSPTAVILPVAKIAAGCRERGVRCLIDGAHAPGMVALDIDGIDADWYAGNLHKWVCAPKGCAFLVASVGTAPWTHPETTSHFHGHGFAKEFDWQGTRDFANWLAIPEAIKFVQNGYPGGISVHNHRLAVLAQQQLCTDFSTQPVSPLDGSKIGSMATVELPAEIARAFPSASLFQARLYEHHHIEVPVIDWGGKWYVRVSAQAYNAPEDYLALSAAVASEVSAGGI